MDQHKTGQLASSAARKYESLFVPALFDCWPQHVMKAANIGENHCVLDVACGTGVLTRAVAAKLRNSANIIGLDINQGMLDVARSIAPSIGWQQGSAEELPFDDASYDRVVSQFGLMFFPDRVRGLREMQRVCRPTGRLTIAVWGSLKETPGYAAMHRLLEKLFGNSVAASLEVPYALGDLSQLWALLNEAGMSSARVETIVETANFTSLDEWVYTDIRAWTLAEQIDDDQFAVLQKTARHELSEFVMDCGAVRFAHPAHVVSFDMPLA